MRVVVISGFGPYQKGDEIEAKVDVAARWIAAGFVKALDGPSVPNKAVQKAPVTKKKATKKRPRKE